jgi:predicted ATPase/transcriptional regulator with XRE-family HTH domain
MTDRLPVPIAASRHPTREHQNAVAFGDLMRQFRIAAGLTQEELAARASVSVRAVSDLERAQRRRPQRETLRLLADALDLNDEQQEQFETAARTRFATPPRLVPREAPPSNLPVSITPLVDRESDLAAVVTLLDDPATRLVTLMGAGGVGKTRLALEVATAVLPSFTDGVFFVSLAAIRDPGLVLSTIARTFGLRERRAESLHDALISHLERKRLALVLDNFEQLIPAAALVADLLTACSGLTVLATSRAALHIRGEHEYRLRPLPLPDLQETDDIEEIRRSPAVELFMQRATAINRDLALAQTNARAIAQICARLDGLPLALELAAARTRVLQPAELLARLDHRFSVLTDGATDLPTRQQTMGHAIDWSYDLLNPDEQRLFRWLAVFAGGCTLEAAEALGSALGGSPVNLLSGLSSLVDKSLIQAEARGGATRFVMLETVREYGLERLAAAGETATVRRAHATYFLAMAATDADSVGDVQARWLARLDAEYDNFRAALAWAHEHDEAESGVRLAAALWDFWYTRGYLREGRAWIETMLALEPADAAPPRARAIALRGVATLAVRQGDIAAAERYTRATLAAFRTIDDKRGMAAAHNLLGNTAFARNDYPEAMTCYMECLSLRRESNDREGIGRVLSNLGRTARFQGDYERAVAFYREGEAVNRATGDTQGLASNLGNQGHMMRDRGDPAGALPLIEESLACYEQIGEKRGTGIALGQLAMIAFDTGKYADARAYADRSLAIRRAIDDRWGIAQSLVIIGDIAVATDDRARAWPCYRDGLTTYREIDNDLGVVECIERFGRLMADDRMWANAARCFGAASTIRGRIHAPVLPVDLPVIERAIADSRTALGEAAWIAAYDTGRAMDIGAIVGEIAGIAAPSAR